MVQLCTAEIFDDARLRPQAHVVAAVVPGHFSEEFFVLNCEVEGAEKACSANFEKRCTSACFWKNMFFVSHKLERSPV